MTVAHFITSYVVFEILLVVCAVGFTWWGRKRRLRSKGQRPPHGFQPTDEAFIDPTTGKKQRVWFNPETGERYYETVER